MRISVVMAACNGATYIAEQVQSITCQLSCEDELIISVDPSEDDTMVVAQTLASADKRIKLLEGPGKGVVANFEQCFGAAKGDYIFPSDDDDVWHQDKIKLMLDALNTSGAMMAIHDAELVDEHLDTIAASYFAIRGSKPGILPNILKNSYMGCCMLFRRSLLDYALPFPANIPMHDQWLGLLAEMHGKVSFVQRQLIKYRRHGKNATSLSHSSALRMFIWRIILISQLLRRKMRGAAAR
jgi:glycosyltransferase involved in cell wall biosynthesis